MCLKSYLCVVILFKICLIGALRVQRLEPVWNLSDSTGEYTNLHANVPGGIYTNLMNNGIIGDVFYGENDVDTRWVANRTWKYEQYLAVNATLLDHKYVKIIFDGVDTFANVYVDSKLVGITNNMFVRYEFDVKPFLKIGNNNISIVFKSAIIEANALYEEQNKNYTVKPVCVPDGYNGECHVNHIRKMQASFAWDWGPAFPSVGLWKKVYLEAYNTSAIKDVTVETKETYNDWQFNVTTYFANTGELLKGSLIITIFTDFDKVQNIFDLNISAGDEIDRRGFTIPKSHFKLWWPNGMGDQNLYVMKVSYINHDNAEQSMKRFKIGLRTVEVVQETLTSGLSFYFKINGIPMFAKGTNMIPSHILPELAANEAKLRFLLQSSKDAHMNMIRVWGGGLYEADKFYEMADEMGILIWQDFMFACSMYPTNDDFINNVKIEVQQQVRRLQHHASIALWAGNNENEAALSGNWYGTNSKFDLYKADYVKLYVDTIRTVVLQNDNSRIFLVSSPTNGIKSEEDGFVSKSPQSTLYGDVHYYNYILDSWNQNIYPITRFASEYGYQSLPSVKSILTATSNISDLNTSSRFMQHRQHHFLGYIEMEKLMRDRLNLPTAAGEKRDRAFIFYSQIIQAMAIKIETEYYRQWRDNFNEKGEGGTMGALYWQLNDVWIGPTWAGIDFNNNWKMLHYYAKDFFAPIITTAHLLPTRELNVYVISDKLTPIFNATLTIKTYKWNDFRPLDVVINVDVDVTTGSKNVVQFDVDKHVSTLPCGPMPTYNCFIVFELTANGSKIGPDNIFLPEPIKSTKIQTAKLKVVSVVLVKPKQFIIVVSANTVAAFVWLECDVPGRFSENGFFQINYTKEVIFDSDINVDVKGVTEAISVTHLMDEQYF